MNEVEQQRAIRTVLAKLLSEGEDWLRAQRPDGEGLEVANVFAPLRQPQLDSYLNFKPRGEFKPGEGIRVKPPARESVAAALRCKWNFERQRATCCFHLGVWLRDGHFIGFRFEPPEEVGDNHNYYHSQPCRTMGDDKPISRALKVPERNPTWPLPATSSLDLLLCLVLSIHGMEGLRTMKEEFDRDHFRHHALIGAIEKMICRVSPPTA